MSFGGTPSSRMILSSCSADWASSALAQAVIAEAKHCWFGLHPRRQGQGGRGQRMGYGVKRAPRAKKRLARKYKPDGLLSDGSHTFLHENDTKTIEAKKKKPRSQPSIPWAFAAHLLDQSQSLLVCTGRLGIGRGGSDRLLPSLPPSFASRAKSRVNIAARSTSCRYQSRSRLAMTAVDEKGGEAILPDGWRSKDRAPTLL